MSAPTAMEVAAVDAGLYGVANAANADAMGPAARNLAQSLERNVPISPATAANAVTKLTAAVVAQPADATLASSLWTAVAALCRANVAFQEIFRTNGVVGALVASARTHETSVDASTAIFSALFTLAYKNYDVTAVLYDAGALDFVQARVNALFSGENTLCTMLGAPNKPLIIAVWQAVRSLAGGKNRRGSDFFNANRTVERVNTIVAQSAIEVETKDGDVIAAVFGAMVGLTFNNDVNRAFYRENDAIPAILKLMSHFRGHHQLQAIACRTLKNLAYDLTANSYFEGISRQVMDLTIEAMKTHADEPLVQEDACYLLSTLAYLKPETRENMRTTNYLTLVINVLQSHLKNPLVCIASISALRNYSLEIQNRTYLRTANAIDYMLTCMATHPMNAPLQSIACAALCALGLQGENQEYMERHGAPKLILEAMTNHADDKGVAESTCNAIWAIALLARNRPIIVGMGAIEKTVHMLERHLTSVEVARAGLGALRTFGLDDETRPAMVHSGALRVAAAAMAEHVRQEDVQRHGCVVAGQAYDCSAQPLKQVMRETRGLVSSMLSARTQYTHQDITKNVSSARLRDIVGWSPEIHRHVTPLEFRAALRALLMMHMNEENPWHTLPIEVFHAFAAHLLNLVPDNALVAIGN